MPKKVAKKKVVKTGKKLSGRKLFDGRNEEEVIRSLSAIWSIGGSDAQAALYAGLDKTTLSRVLKRRPDILQRKERLKEQPSIKARKTVVENLNDVNTAKWYLERKHKDEFSLKSPLGGDGDGPVFLPIKVTLYDGKKDKK